MAANHRVVHFDGKIEQAVGIVAALAVAFANLRIDQGGVLRRVDLNVGAAETNKFGDFIAKQIDEVGEKGVHGGIGSAGLLGIVVGRGLLGAQERRLGGMIGARAQVGVLFGAHVPLAPQLRNDHG